MCLLWADCVAKLRNDRLPSLVGGRGQCRLWAHQRGTMARNTLAGRLILIAEDVAVIAMEIESTFKDAGARIRICSTVEDALVVAEDRDLAAAVVNLSLIHI